MNDELDVFDTKPTPPPLRYSVPVHPRAWDLLEDLVVWPVIAPRGSRAEYGDACVWLCETINRVPLCVPAKLVAESVALIEMRSVTRHLEGLVAGLAGKAWDLLNGYRTGLPLSWAERYEILISYNRKRLHERPRIFVAALLCLLGRTEADRPLIADYLHRIEHGGVDFTERPDPIFDPSTAARLVQRSVKTPSPKLWAEMVRACGGKAVV